MSKSEEEYLLELWKKNTCPYCGNALPEGKRVGSGQKRSGGFCSLDCYAKYYAVELAQRAQRLSRIAADHKDS